jgi:hypothetical protein
MKIDHFLRRAKAAQCLPRGVAYGVVAWLLIQVATQVFPFFEIPNSAIRFVVIALAIGFPIAMALSWLYELTPEGIVRSEDLEPAQARKLRRLTGRVLDFVIIGVLLLVIAMLFYQRLSFRSETGETIPQKSIAVCRLKIGATTSKRLLRRWRAGRNPHSLINIADLKVISRTPTQHYKSAPDNLREIAKQ